LLLLWCVILLAYSDSFHGALVFDNARAISQDARIQAASSDNIRLIFTKEYWYQSGPSGLYRPLTTISYLWNYAILGDGPHPEGYHWVNLALHAVNVSLVYALGWLVLGEATWALGLAAIWGLHPLLTDSVTNIVGRADLLAALGVLAGLLCYVRATAPGGHHRLAWIACLAVAQTVGIFSKENAAVLPGIMLLYDLAWPERTTWRRRAPAYAALALPFAVFFLLRASVHSHMRIDPAENPLVSAGFWAARLTATKVIGRMLGLFLWPARLSADYSYNAVPLFTWAHPDLTAFLALAVCLSAMVLAICSRQSRKPLFFFILFFFVALSPTSNLIFLIGSIMAERFVYLPSIGLAGCVVVLLARLERRTAWLAMSLLCLACGARTYARNLDWQDERTFWAATANACPEAARPHNNLGVAIAPLPGQLPDAIAQFQAALRIRPDYADAHYNLGNAWSVMPGRLPDAISEYEAAIRINPDFAPAHYGLGSNLAQIPGREPAAIAEFEATLRLQPDNARAHNNLGTLLSEVPGRLPEAIAQFQAALRIQPDYVKARVNLAGTLARMPGRLPEAIAELEEGMRIHPDPEIQQLLDRLRDAER
jgi:protein O-mannosyl-transferase